MSSISTRTDWKGDTYEYSGSRTPYYLMRHRAERQQRKLIDFCEPYVEVGFDANQIQAELQHQGIKLIPLGSINSAINIILGA